MQGSCLLLACLTMLFKSVIKLLSKVFQRHVFTYMFCFRELIVRQKESLEVIPRAGKKKEIRLIQQAAQHEVAAGKSDLLH